jgi:hypothetical protein
MITTERALKSARLALGLSLSAGLIFFLYSKSSPPIVGTLIMLAAVFFLFLDAEQARSTEVPIFGDLHCSVVGSRFV